MSHDMYRTDESYLRSLCFIESIATECKQEAANIHKRKKVKITSYGNNSIKSDVFYCENDRLESLYIVIFFSFISIKNNNLALVRGLWQHVKL